MTLSGREVSDDLFARLRRFYGDDALVELTTIIAWENASSKFNRALRIPSQGLWTGANDLETEDVRIRVIGEVAIIHARTTYKKPDGQAGAGRYTDIWSRRQGRWLCVAAHVARG